MIHYEKKKTSEYSRGIPGEKKARKLKLPVRENLKGMTALGTSKHLEAAVGDPLDLSVIKKRGSV